LGGTHVCPPQPWREIDAHARTFVPAASKTNPPQEVQATGLTHKFRSYCPEKIVILYGIYGEAMFQIWWRSVHKWRHNLVHSRRTDTLTWFLSKAYALHCMGQTKTNS